MICQEKFNSLSWLNDHKSITFTPVVEKNPGKPLMIPACDSGDTFLIFSNHHGCYRIHE